MLGTPETAFLTSGTASTDSPLTSFDAALIDAGLGDANLIPVSSVVPEDCRLVEPREVGDGELLPCVLARDQGEGGPLNAAVAIALSEEIGMAAEATGPDAEERAAEDAERMLETRGLETRELLVESVALQPEGCGAAVAVLGFGTDF